MAGLMFLTFLAAWERVLQDAQVNKFSLASVDSASCVVGPGVQVVNGVVGCGTLIVRRDRTNVQGAYTAIQLHPPHAHVKGAGGRLWHFHVRNVKLKEDRHADDVENVFMIYEKGWEGKCKYVDVLPNKNSSGCSSHYYVETAPGGNAEFEHHVRQFADTLCGKVPAGHHKTHLQEIV